MIGGMEVVVLGLLALVAALALLGRKLPVPYPILLVTGGVLLSLIPGLPVIRLNPELVFLKFLPPLLYPAALFTSWRDFRADLRPILLLAIGLQLPAVARALSGHSKLQLLGYASAVSAAVILVRLLWVFPAAYLPRWLFKGLRRRDPYPNWRVVAEELRCLGWSAEDLVRRPKNGPGKLAIAVRLRRETMLTIKAITARVHPGTYNTANARLHRAMKEGVASSEDAQATAGK